MDAPELQADHGSILLKQLQRMRAAEELTDVVLLAEGIPFACHKVVLSAFSPYFQVVWPCTIQFLCLFRKTRDSVCLPEIILMSISANKYVEVCYDSIIVSCYFGKSMCTGYVYMWPERDSRWRGSSQRYSCTEPEAATGLHVLC